jgi:hypothetical protein
MSTMEENYKKKKQNTKRIRVIDDDNHLNHNDNVIHDFLPYPPK